MIKLQIPQYRFHYYVQDDKIENYKSHDEFKNGENYHGSYGVVDSNGGVQSVNYRADKSNGLQTDENLKSSTLPSNIPQNDPTYRSQIDATKESTESSKTLPIVVEPINTPQEQNTSRSIEMDSTNEYHLTESTDKATQFIEQVSTNQTEDRNDDIKDEQVTDQILIQDEGSSHQTEFTIPFKKPNPVNEDDFKYNDEETLKKDIVKLIQNINGNNEQSDLRLNFKSSFSDKPLKVIGSDSMEMERQQNYKPSHEHSSFKSQQLSNKPIRLFGYNPSVFGSLYDMHVDYRPPQIQQPPNLHNQGHNKGFVDHRDDVKPQIYDSSEIYHSPSSSTSQTGNYKGNQKYNALAPTQPLYYYDPNSMVMLPVYTNMIQNVYPISENKPVTSQPQTGSNKNGFNLMQILSGGTFYKGSEQAESSQQMAVKDSIKHEHNKLEKPKPSEAYNKSKIPQTLMFYLNPDDSPIDLKSLISNPMQLPSGQVDCNGQKLKIPAVKADKTLQPIPLCSDCVPALGLMSLPSTKSTAIQQKKSITSPQVMPIWNGKNISKLSYLILPTPITK